MRQAIAKQVSTEKITERAENKVDKSNILNSLETAMQGAENFGKKYGTDFTDSFLNMLTDDVNQFDTTAL